MYSLINWTFRCSLYNQCFFLCFNTTNLCLWVSVFSHHFTTSLLEAPCLHLTYRTSSVHVQVFHASCTSQLDCNCKDVIRISLQEFIHASAWPRSSGCNVSCPTWHHHCTTIRAKTYDLCSTGVKGAHAFSWRCRSGWAMRGGVLSWRWLCMI